MTEKRILLVAFIVHLIAVFYSTGHLHPDEHFQVLEFMNFKLHHIPMEVMPWELKAQIRPWSWPALLYALAKIFMFLHIDNVFVWTTLFRLFASLFGLYSIYFFYQSFKSDFKGEKEQKFFLFWSLLFWFFPFIHARLSGEALSCAALALAIGIIKRQSDRFPPNLFNLFTSGLFLGLAFEWRYHSAFIALSLILWSYFKARFGLKDVLFIVCGGLLILGLSSMIDYWGYNEWSFPPWNYVYQNLILHKAQGYGVAPWWSYLLDINRKLIPPWSWLLLVSAVIFFYHNPKHIITCCLLPFFLIHSFIGHKEWRFLIPLTIFVPYIFTWGLLFLKNKFQLRAFWPYPLIAGNLLLMLFSSIQSNHPSFGFYQYLNSSPPDQKTIYFKGEVDPFFIHQLTPTLYLPKNVKTSPYKDTLARPYLLFVSTFADFEHFQNNCQLLYSSRSPKAFSLLPSRWKKRSKIWALLSCP